MYSLLLGRMVSFSSHGRQYALSRLVERRRKTGLLLCPFRRSRDLHLRRQRWQREANHFLPRTGCFAYLEPQDQLPDRLGAAAVPAYRRSTSWSSDGTGVQRMTDGGYATSPSWSPSGQFLAFAWNRKYGPGAPGGQDIYIMDIASKRWTQLTHDAGRQGFSLLVAGWAAHRISTRERWGIRNMDHAFRWHRTASPHAEQRKLDA